MFSVNSLLRGLIETYTTFNHILVYPETEMEKHFRFLLWQLDALQEQQKFGTKKTDFVGAEKMLADNQQKIDGLHPEIESHTFLQTLDESFGDKLEV